jgi:hypothetical protein
MFRPAESIAECFRQKDWFAVLMLAIVVLISTWIASTLFFKTTRELSIRRFQLASSSWLQWAALAPVPAMYNYENRIQFTNERIEEGPFNKDHESWFECPVNHFPARCVTFGEFAPTWFDETRSGTFEMSTRFRETELVSRWEIREEADGTMQVYRLSENWVQHDARK